MIRDASLRLTHMIQLFRQTDRDAHDRREMHRRNVFPRPEILIGPHVRLVEQVMKKSRVRLSTLSELRIGPLHVTLVQLPEHKEVEEAVRIVLLVRPRPGNALARDSIESNGRVTSSLFVAT